jgi:hypothetical protein
MVPIVTKQGQTVNLIQSAPTIIKVAQIDVMTVKAQISEADVTRVRIGCQSTLRFWTSPIIVTTQPYGPKSRRPTPFRKTRPRHG